VKELTTSRDSWKNKAKKINNTSNDLERENMDLKKRCKK